MTRFRRLRAFFAPLDSNLFRSSSPVSSAHLSARPPANSCWTSNVKYLHDTFSEAMCFFGVLLTAACSGLRILLKDATYFFDPLDSNLFWSSHLSLGGYLFFFFFFFFLTLLTADGFAKCLVVRCLLCFCNAKRCFQKEVLAGAGMLLCLCNMLQ